MADGGPNLDPTILANVRGGRRRRRGVPWVRLGLFVLLCTLAALPFTGFPDRLLRQLRGLAGTPPPRASAPVRTVPAPGPDAAAIEREVEQRLRGDFERQRGELERELAAAREKLARFEDESKPAAPTEHIATTGGDVRKLSSGIPFITEVKVDKGGVAAKERTDSGSFTASYTLQVRVPEPAQTLEQLEAATPGLAGMLPELPGMLAAAKVAPFFHQLYAAKTEQLKGAATSLNELLSKHNFYDCQTILHLTHPGSGRRVFLMQAEMDVVADGSDGDRLASMPAEVVDSTNYQPFTSYGWPKRTATPNPLVAGWQRRIEGAEKELADPATTAERRKWLRERIAYLKRGIADMKSRSFLIAEYDPFIVMPTPLLTRSGDPFAPRTGDYAVVVHAGKVYPAIVGDGGPAIKVGEASLRLAREINPKASPYSRPVSDLTVIYLVFPGSREEKKGPPDYAAWRARCAGLLDEIGGLGAGTALHDWQDLLPKPAAPEAPGAPGAPAGPAAPGASGAPSAS